MKKVFILATTACLAAISLPVDAQDYDGSFALPENLAPQPKKYPVAYPRPMSDGELKEAFANPPRGYGNVPFYWWTGDKLTKERLEYELDILKDAHTEGFAVSYTHTHPDVDRDTHSGQFGGFGTLAPTNPPIFTPEWHKIWNWFSELCGKNQIGLGLDDYVFAWPGNGFYNDKVMGMPGIRDYAGELVFIVDTLNAGAKYNARLSDNFLSCIAWNSGGESHDLGAAADGKEISWTAPAGTWTVYYAETKPNHMLHPEYGKEIVKNYFGEMEKDMTPAQKEGMNFFFQDELFVPLDINTWSEDMSRIFRETKGYDIIPYLGALKGDIGTMTDKVRLDYCEVLMDIAEARYFKPIFDWHWDRGLIYGCDNLGRGLDPGSYVDYFRATRWFTAPGNDAPARGSSLMQCKVSSSIAHLYQRPRTWLEAFHSMGWGSDGEILTAQLDHHMVGGGNLLCLHGLYYSTRGGWWEWAPPDFHFRMPYWPHMKYWLGYAERMSFILSQGSHVCDVAIIYPTENSQAFNAKPSGWNFQTAQALFNKGMDFDFIDYQSLRRSDIQGGKINVSGEGYRVLVIEDMPSLHHSSLEKALEHFRDGGIVVATGQLTGTTTLNGANDPTVDAMIAEMFGISAAQQKAGAMPKEQKNAAGGIAIYTDKDNIYNELAAVTTPDFRAGAGQGKVMHRRIGSRDLYMVLNVEPGTEMFFRSTGRAEAWDAFSGEIRPLPVSSQDENGTIIISEADQARSTLIVFTPGEEPVFRAPDTPTSLVTVNSVPVDGEWEIEYVPTLDNRFGDFRLPALPNEVIGPEARTFAVMDSRKAPKGWNQPGFDYGEWESRIYGYGLQAQVCKAGPTADFGKFAADALANDVDWEPYEFSWQFGVWDNPGSQGYHGLKGRVSDGFYIMGEDGHYAFDTQVYAPVAGLYRIEVEATRPDLLYIDGKETTAGAISLSKGWHPMTALYKDVRKGTFDNGMSYYDARTRSAVVLIPASSPTPKAHDEFTEELSMKWLDAKDRLLFDPMGGKTRSYCYLFDAQPGLAGFEMNVFGDRPKVWIDGAELPKAAFTVSANEEGSNKYTVKLPALKSGMCRVAIEVAPFSGYAAAGVFDGAVKLDCGKGIMLLRDWKDMGQMIHYSGGLWYRKNLDIERRDLSQRVFLDLGNVIATCEVHVNGRNAGILLSKPFSIDITDYLNDGENLIEVLVYSTLSNHYQIIPTPKHYRGTANAGMKGPVAIEYKAFK